MEDSILPWLLKLLIPAIGASVIWIVARYDKNSEMEPKELAGRRVRAIEKPSRIERAKLLRQDLDELKRRLD